MIVELTLEIPVEVMEALERLAREQRCGPVDVAESLLYSALKNLGYMKPLKRLTQEST